MTFVEKIIYCLAMTETVNDIRAWGDDRNEKREPLAMGRFQIHPARFRDLEDRYTHYPASTYYTPPPRVRESWDSYTTRLITSMIMERVDQGHAPADIASYHHLGHFAPLEPLDAYVARFTKYWNRSDVD